MKAKFIVSISLCFYDNRKASNGLSLSLLYWLHILVCSRELSDKLSYYYKKYVSVKLKECMSLIRFFDEIRSKMHEK